MRHAMVAVLLVISILKSLPAFCQQAYRPDGFELMLVYYKLSGLPVPWDDLAQHYSEFRQAKNEFDRKAVLEQLHPVMLRTFNEVGSISLFSFQTNVGVGTYDFMKKRFPLSFGPYMYAEVGTNVPGPTIALLFLNSDKLAEWPLEPDEAKMVADRLGNFRSVAAELQYEPRRAREAPLNGPIHRILDVEITRALLSTSNRTQQLGAFTPQ